MRAAVRPLIPLALLLAVLVPSSPLAAAPRAVAPPGTVVDAVAITAPTGARAWKVLYHSRALDGRDITVSGVVVAPIGPTPAGGRPVVTWAHGTSGIGDRCAPSGRADVATTLPWEQELLDRGAVIAATDYEGLGTPGVHPYLVGESEGRGVLDAARAARRIGGARNRAGAGDTVIVAGHSQGGQAALFAGQLAPTYAPELHVRGVVALAPAPDPALVVAAAMANPAANGFAGMVLEGLRAAFPKAGVDAVMTPEAEQAIEAADRTGCGAEIFTALRDIVVVRADPSSVPSVRDALARSSAGHVPTKIPLLVLQGDADTTVPEVATQAYVTRACALGDTVSYQRFPTAGHSNIPAIGAASAEAWVDRRLAGEPPPDTC